MTWQAVARKDFRDAVRSKWLWALSLLFVAVFALPPILLFYLEMGATPQQGQSGTTDMFVFLMKQGTSILIPLIAIVIGYTSITQERESGSLKLLLSLPHSRDDVVFGKVLGRSGVIALPIAVGFAVAFLVLLFTSLSLKLVNLLLFAALTAVLGLVFVGLSVGVSAAASTGQRAMVAAIALFIWFVVLWNSFANQVVNALVKYVGISEAARYQTVLFLKLLNPTQAYKTLVDTVLMDSALQSRIYMFGIFKRKAVAQAFGDSLPIYLSDPFVVAYFLAWLFVPVAVGLRKFSNDDL
ncbi:ABC transporter permease [Halorussus gelatinilyticus]|uniref:ABC transporter permease n=1 Tax=Halorussus gelatinilyticus TaxID=2937524 RepID=A0A8U0IN58_9EURY|nr:ABC transporter permease subunit [Halorussus gelatinilyticus]UPW02065.1 ABC transporter permease [Halorussus gelatinilyticus]